jgi:hypothetical protein
MVGGSPNQHVSYDQMSSALGKGTKLAAQRHQPGRSKGRGGYCRNGCQKSSINSPAGQAWRGLERQLMECWAVCCSNGDITAFASADALHNNGR